jgi:hypothetical protein
VSKQSYPSEDTVRLKSTAANVQKYYKIDDQFYQALSVVEKYITWDVHIRRVNR